MLPYFDAYSTETVLHRRMGKPQLWNLCCGGCGFTYSYQKLIVEEKAFTLTDVKEGTKLLTS
jgi:hypothetical protein